MITVGGRNEMHDLITGGSLAIRYKYVARKFLESQNIAVDNG